VTPVSLANSTIDRFKGGIICSTVRALKSAE